LPFQPECWRRQSEQRLTSFAISYTNESECCSVGGYIQDDLVAIKGRKLGLAVDRPILSFEEKIGFPTRFYEVTGFITAHIRRALTAAKNPQLRMKLENMPVSLTAEIVDEYMAPILQAAASGDLTIIKNIPD